MHGSVVALVYLALCVLLLGGAGDVTAQVPAHELPTARNSLPQFTGITLEGDTIQSSEYENKIVIINFWAIWCGPCIKELPHIQSLYERYKNNESVRVETVYLKNPIGGKSRGEVRKWVKERRYAFKVIFDQQRSIQDSFGFKGIPLNLLVGKEGYLFEIDNSPLNTFESRVAQRVSERLSGAGSSKGES